MKKIGIVTILKCNNFGAELQAYATQKKLSLMGYDAEIIDMLYYKHPDFKNTRRSKPFVKQTTKTQIIEFIKFTILNPIIYNIIPLFSKNMRIRNRKFDNFHKENTKLSKTYRTVDSLYNNCDEYDAYIVGSDQVWNPGTGMNLEPFFLTFAPNNKKKISYASSFGVSKLPKQYESKFNELLNNLNHISVREKEGAEIVKDVANREAQVVLDPTLLLNKAEWNSCSSNHNPNPKGYVLVYEVHPSAKIQQLALDYAQKNNLPVFRVGVRGMFNWETEGITNLVDCVATKTPVTVVLLDNTIVAMTGCQPTMLPSSQFEPLIKGLGVEPEHIRVLATNPANREANTKVLIEEAEYRGVSVVIMVRECLEAFRIRNKKAKK